MASWPFSKPPGAVLGLRTERLTSVFRRLETKHTLSHQAHRFRFELQQPSQLLIKVSSNVATAKGWHRAGYLAHRLRGTPVTSPVADVEPVYFDPQYISFPWSGLAYYLEFWPHVWISDYRIDLWARETITPQTIVNSEPQAGVVWFDLDSSGPEPFIFFGTPIIFP